MTENESTRSARRPTGRHPYSTWWLLAKNGNPLAEVLTLDSGGERTMPTFSGEGEAEMFLWLGSTFEHGWHVRETSAGELVSLLSGPYARVQNVALDPSPEMAEAGTIDLVSVGRKKFIGRIFAFDRKERVPVSGQICEPRRPVCREAIARAASFRSYSSGGCAI